MKGNKKRDRKESRAERREGEKGKLHMSHMINTSSK